MPGSDGMFDSCTGVVPGCRVTFQIVARNDGFLPPACTDHIFTVDLVVVGGDAVEADRCPIVVHVPGARSRCTP
jgi:hypothetical protein